MPAKEIIEKEIKAFDELWFTPKMMLERGEMWQYSREFFRQSLIRSMKQMVEEVMVEKKVWEAYEKAKKEANEIIN